MVQPWYPEASTVSFGASISQNPGDPAAISPYTLPLSAQATEIVAYIRERRVTRLIRSIGGHRKLDPAVSKKTQTATAAWTDAELRWM
jgi:hypothetical protein